MLEKLLELTKTTAADVELYIESQDERIEELEEAAAKDRLTIKALQELVVELEMGDHVSTLTTYLTQLKQVQAELKTLKDILKEQLK